LKISITAYTNELKNLDENKSALKTAEINSEDIVAKLEELREPELKAKIRLETVQDIYDKLFTSSEDIMSKIRSSLSIGDICPVCRNKIINALPTDESIAVLTSERKKDLDNARKNLDEIIRSKTKLNSELAAEQRQIAKLKDKIENNKSLGKAENNLKNNCELLGIECDKSIDILALLQLYNDRVLDISSRDKALSCLIAEAERLEINIKDRNNEIKALNALSQKSSDSYNQIILNITSCDKQIEVLKDQIKQFGQEIEDLDSRLNEELKDSLYFSLISRPDNFNSLRSTLKSDADEMKDINELLYKKTTLREKLNINLTNHLSTLNSITEILPELTEDMSSSEEPHREITIRQDQLATFGT
ncbi:MAG: hypothetical protein K2K97_09310, partial [Muribaculaceae bacterium]|nr:hypothetical protein [Muribaculaceae bacterium]